MPVWLWNLVDLKRIQVGGARTLTPGRHTVVFDFKYDGQGAGTLAFNNFSGVGRPGTRHAEGRRQGRRTQTMDTRSR